MSSIQNTSLADFDLHIRKSGYTLIAGVDEAGRGPWAGPVVVSAVILSPSSEFIGQLNDSKKLSHSKRETLYKLIKEQSYSYSIFAADEKVIDSLNILSATRLAFKYCIQNLSEKPDIVLIDGNSTVPDIKIKQQCIIQGDSASASIAAASILAKVTRDKIMANMDNQYPEYKFAEHKGYGTKLHKQMLEKHSPCLIHRRSYKPIKELLIPVRVTKMII